MRQLGARVDAELAIDPRERHFDRLDADEEGCGDILVGATCRDELGDSRFGVRQHVLLAGSAARDPLKLLLCPLDPRRRAELGEDLERVPERVAGPGVLAQTAAQRAEREERPPAIERQSALTVERLLQLALRRPQIALSREDGRARPVENRGAPRWWTAVHRGLERGERLPPVRAPPPRRQPPPH